VGLVLLLPIYILVLGENLTWWWPKSKWDATLFVAIELPKVILLSGFSVCWVRLLFLNKEKIELCTPTNNPPDANEKQPTNKQ
jgi:hypothetical protein